MTLQPGADILIRHHNKGGFMKKLHTRLMEELTQKELVKKEEGKMIQITIRVPEALNTQFSGIIDNMKDANVSASKNWLINKMIREFINDTLGEVVTKKRGK